jgi:hypothetical protein
MTRAVALAAAASLLAAVPAEAKPRGSKPLRFAPKCAAKKRPACRATRWRAVVRPGSPAAPVVPAGSPSHAPREGVAPSVPPADTKSDAPGAAAPAPPPPPPAPLCDPSPWLGVIAEDVNGFRLRLTRLCVPEGTVLFQFRNNDLAFHNVWAEGTDPVRPARRVVDDTPGETVVTASAELAAGEWRLYCSLPGHEAMKRLVDVTPAG